MNGKRVLVTGAAGFIGSNLANQLSVDNDVIALDDVDFVEASALDEDLPADVDVLFHLAALSSRSMHENDP